MYDLPIINNFNLNYLERIYYENDNFNILDSRILNLSISKMLRSNLSFSISGFKEFAGDKNSGAYLSLNYSLGNNKNAYFSHSTDNETRVQFVKASPAQTGFDYVLGANQRRGNLAYQAAGLLKSNVGDLRVQLDQSDEYENNQVIYRGAIVWLGGKVALTKSVDNAFALVKVQDSPEIDVARSLSPVGSTNKNGYLFVHNIIPYVPYDISFDQNQLAIEDAFDYSSQKMIGLNQRGYILDFPVYHTQQVILRLLDQNNQQMPRTSEVYINGEESQYFPVDAQGRVYLYGLKPNKYRFLAKAKGGETCQGTFEVSNQNQKALEQSVMDVICR
jgi:outer membrane usher protein